jgi:hypothetical protein
MTDLGQELFGSDEPDSKEDALVSADSPKDPSPTESQPISTLEDEIDNEVADLFGDDSENEDVPMAEAKNDTEIDQEDQNTVEDQDMFGETSSEYVFSKVSKSCFR